MNKNKPKDNSVEVVYTKDYKQLPKQPLIKHPHLSGEKGDTKKVSPRTKEILVDVLKVAKVK